MKNWLSTLFGDLGFLGREFKKEFLDISADNSADENSVRKFEPSRENVRPYKMKNSNSIISYRR